MNKKEKYGMICLIISILLFQIWVADAETQLKSEKSLSDKPAVIQAMNKIVITDKELRAEAGFAPQAEDGKNQEVATVSTVKKAVAKTEEKAGFIWYKPWTWFN